MRKIVLTLFLLTLSFSLVYGQNAKLQVIHNSADIDLRVVDVYLDDVLAFDDFTFRTATAFTEVAAGAHNIKVSPSDKVPGDSLIAEFNVNLDAGKNYVAIANGCYQVNLDAGKYTNPDPGNRSIAFTLFPIADAQ
jgi:hypothetical protein